jgi:lipopolysaccharide biosynthesis glycosyltransferase
MSDAKTCLVLATDGNLTAQTEALLSSINENYHDSEKLDVVILVPPDLGEWKLRRQYESLDISFVKVTQIEEPDIQESVKLTYRYLRLPPASMYRYFMADLLPGYSKAVYLDIDLIVTRDISPLLNFKLNNPIGVFVEMQMDFPDNVQYKDSAYFNSGVMVVDLDYWRENEISKKLIELSKRVTMWTGAGDQDVLNILFRNNFTSMPVNFNYLINMYKNLDIRDPLIVHWAGKTKPWDSMSPDSKWKQLWKRHSL